MPRMITEKHKYNHYVALEEALLYAESRYPNVNPFVILGLNNYFDYDAAVLERERENNKYN